MRGKAMDWILDLILQPGCPRSKERHKWAWPTSVFQCCDMTDSQRMAASSRTSPRVL